MNKWSASAILFIAFFGTLFGCVFLIRPNPTTAEAPTPPQPSLPAVSISTTISTTSTPPEQTESTFALERHWLDAVNALRRERGLSQLVLDRRLMASAHDWAVWMGTHDALTHDRPDGRTMHQWIVDYDLPYTVRGAPDGWTTNYFVENIGRAYADETIQSEKAGLDEVFNFMLSEGEDGVHVRSMVLPDWNSMGAGFYFEPVSPGRVRIYMAFHYASLANNETP